jgi:hypothetical protein
MDSTRFNVVISKSAIKSASKMPKREKVLLNALIHDLKMNGTIQKRWPNFSALSENTYHCHLSYKWVACWRNEKGSIIIEVYYAGSREKGPY